MAKLLMITGLGSAEDLVSGKKGAFYNTLEEFSKYWERIDIIVPKISNLKSETLNTEDGLILFGNVYVHISSWPLIFHPIWFLKKGIQIYKEQKFDLMTVHEFPPFYNGIGARLLWCKIKVPYVLEIHHVPGYPKSANLKEKMYLNLMKWFIRFDASKAVAIRVVNKKQTPEFLIKAGISQNKIVYIPSMYIDVEVFKPLNLTKEYDLIFIGRLVENKGVNLFFDAVQRIIICNPQLKTIIVGDGPLKDYLKSKINRLKLQKNILLYGWAKDSFEIAELINRSKILIMSSYNEGGPRVVLEAMACGIPVLATNVGLIPDFAGNNVVKIVDWDAEDIAKKVEDLLGNEGEMKRMEKAGLEIAKQFEKKEAIRNYADKLKAILN